MTISAFVLASVAAFAGMTLQAVVGFGSALIVAPALVVLLPVEVAIPATLVLAVPMNLPVLVADRRAAALDRASLRRFALAALPGIVIGAVLLRELPGRLIEAVVGASVLVAVALRLAFRPRPGPAHRAEAVVAGLVSGVLTTATSINGPPLVVWLQHRGLAGASLRRMLAACFLILDLTAIVISALIIGSDAARGVGVALVLLPAMALGFVAGRLILRVIPPGAHDGAVAAVVVAAGLVALSHALWG